MFYRYVCGKKKNSHLQCYKLREMGVFLEYQINTHTHISYSKTSNNLTKAQDYIEVLPLEDLPQLYLLPQCGFTPRAIATGIPKLLYIPLTAA